jgi:hypothetical protein
MGISMHGWSFEVYGLLYNSVNQSILPFTQSYNLVRLLDVEIFIFAQLRHVIETIVSVVQVALYLNFIVDIFCY